MGIFNLFGEQEHRQFNYKPIYFDKEKEERKQIFGKVDGTYDSENKDYVPGGSIRGAFRDGGYSKRSKKSSLQTWAGIAILAMIVIIFFFFIKFFALL